MTRPHAAALTAGLLVGGALLLAQSTDPGAVRLRNRGYAELENEKPALAAATFEALTRVAPEDPLGWANLAIARLRQQDFAGAEKALAGALERAPGDPRLLAIEGEIAHWSGRGEAALDSFRRAADAAPDDLELQYALYRQATILSGEEADEAARRALARMARLRPENLVVLLQLGQRARAAGDRAQATAAFLRVRELAWQAPAGAERILEQVLDGLEAGDLEAIRVPAQRLENVLKITPMYRESLRELSPGIQGIPLTRLRDEPPIESFGPPVDVVFAAARIAEGEMLDVATADFDGDRIPDLARLEAGEARRLVYTPGGDGGERRVLAAPGIERLEVADLDNDGRLDLVGHGAGGLAWWRQADEGFEEKSGVAGLAGGDSATAAAVIDFDIEGDLDVFIAGGESAELYRNVSPEPFERVGARSLPTDRPRPEAASDAVASDLDRDGDLDLVVAGGAGVLVLDNLRQGRFAVAPAAAIEGRFHRLASADFDNDGRPDLATVGPAGGALWRNAGDRFEAFAMSRRLESSAEMTALAVLDADNDGRLDVAVGGAWGVAVAAQRSPGELTFVTVEDTPLNVRALAAADLDGDGDQDLVAATAGGLYRLENRGGNANRWLRVRLRGLDKGNSKNNVFGLGATLEVRAGAAYQFREAAGDVTHFGLGRLETPDLLRVVWTNGVPQNRFEPAANQWIVEEQLLKGSCPFLYAWTGERFDFATDLLWGSPIGLPAGEGRWVGRDPSELVEIERIAPRRLPEGGERYELRITEELWEAAYFDAVRLWVVDHPEEVEVASSLRIVPGGATPERVLASRGLEPVAAAWDARGRDVTARVARRDEVYADGWRPSRYQGVAEGAWAFTFDLGRAPNGPVRLHLDGWIFPTDASLNLAIDQRRGLELVLPRLEVETGSGWQVLLPNLGFPAGKTKTMVIDTPPLPAGARRLRIVTTQWLSWDRLAWTPAGGVADDEPRVLARLAADRAELRFRGFSRPRRQAPNAPHEFDYQTVTTASPWLPFPGRYTRYGEVAELLAEVDDLSVILAAGDEIALSFDVSALPPPAPGWRRAVFLESHGWDKDADRNTGDGAGVEPLPYRAMTAYPYAPDDAFPDGAAHREYRDEWLTRVVEPPAPGELRADRWR